MALLSALASHAQSGAVLLALPSAPADTACDWSIICLQVLSIIALLLQHRCRQHDRSGS